MVLLIRDNCPHCTEFEGIKQKFPEIFVFKVTNGLVDIGDGVQRPIDRKIESLPALITGNAVYMDVREIRNQLNILENSLGEQNDR